MRRKKLRRSQRLPGGHPFSDVIRRGKRQRTAAFSMFYLNNGLAYARLGVSVPRRAAASAVIRNRIKRRVRESFRAEQYRFAGLDIVVIPNGDDRRINFFQDAQFAQKQ